MRYNIEQLRAVIGRVNRAVEVDAELETFREMKLAFFDGTAALSGFMPGFAIEEAFATQGKAMPTISLSGKKLKAIVDHLPGQECDISFDGAKVTIKAGRSRYTLPVAQDRDYMDFRWPQCLDMKTCLRGDLVRALKRCTGAASREDEERPEKAVVHFCENHIVSSDGAVMACQDNKGLFQIETPFNLSMRHAVRVLKTCENSEAETLSYAFKDNTLHLMIGRLAMMVTGIAVTFPSYEVVLQSHRANVSFPINRRRLLEEVSRLAVVAETRERALTLTLSSKCLTLHGVFDGSEVETFVECDIVIKDEMKIGLMLDVLVRGLKTLSAENLLVEVKSPEKPLCFREASYGCYIVPRRF